MKTPTTVPEMFSYLKERLGKLVPEPELKIKADLAVRVNQLKREIGAIILGHNYMEAALFHTVPDFVGDSLALSKQAAETDSEVILFCGVRFMAETAKILNPGKTVLLPAEVAGCSLAASISADEVRDLKVQFPGVPIVTYINTYADVKAECDICCTSSNASKVVQSLGNGPIIFLPDEYLARNIASETGRRVVEVQEGLRKEDVLDGDMIIWRGRCEVHEQFTVEDIVRVRKQFPDVFVLSHPECSPEVVDASDFSGSTTGMVHKVQKSDAPHFLILTECAMGDNIIAENPEKDILRLCSVRCPHMNEITLEGVLQSLSTMTQNIDVPEPIREKALGSVERMLSIG